MAVSYTHLQKEETGRVLLNLKGTDMFEAIVSGQPERGDKVDLLINTCLLYTSRCVYETGLLVLQDSVHSGR